ncbi:hypothetical protein B4114_2278 [Geobacillus stearothermophilus]|uniref:Uncharacterized protein n=4 Tax=Geobacillus TaxID=129337 RepID=A0A150NAS9_GEOSE|nr:hypothetical protein B4114_2278 [Geobacillus stearothermophilus]
MLVQRKYVFLSKVVEFMRKTLQQKNVSNLKNGITVLLCLQGSLDGFLKIFLFFVFTETQQLLYKGLTMSRYNGLVR